MFIEHLLGTELISLIDAKETEVAYFELGRSPDSITKKVDTSIPMTTVKSVTTVSSQMLQRLSIESLPFKDTSVPTNH